VQIFNNVVLRDRPDLRMTRKTCILFPFYRTWELLFRLHALLKNVIEYSTWRRKNIKISEREAHIHDLPPVRASGDGGAAFSLARTCSAAHTLLCACAQVPPEKNPNWWTVWHANAGDGDDSRFKKLTDNIVKNLALDDDLRNRMKSLASAYLMWQKLRLENASIQFPQMLAQHKDADGARVLAEKMQHLQDMFEAKLVEMVPNHQWEMFDTNIQLRLQRWASASHAVLFANPVRWHTMSGESCPGLFASPCAVSITGGLHSEQQPKPVCCAQ